MVDEYLSVPTFYGELPKGDELALEANPTLVARLTGADRDEVRRVMRTATSPADLPPAEELYEASRADDGARAVKLYDAPACPYCARVRIVLAEKGIEYETVEIDLRDRPAWVYELNPPGRVPILDDGFVLPESAVIMEYLEERYPGAGAAPGRRRGARRGAARGVPLRRRCSATTTTPSAAATPNDARPAARGAAGRARASSPTSRTSRGCCGCATARRRRCPPRLDAWLDGLPARPSVARELEVVGALS